LDVAKRKWSTKLLSKLELDSDLLAKVYESEDVTGNLTAAAAKALGLTTDCVVVGGAGDCAANALGTGVVNGGTLSMSLGTSGVMFVHSDDVKVDPTGRLHTFCHAVRDKWHMMGVTLTAAGALNWFVETMAQELAAGKKDPFKVLIDEAAGTPVGSEGLFFLPYLAGERTPHADPDARGSFVGLTLKHQRGHLTRSILEGVAYAMRDSLAIIQEMGVPVKKIIASGGGAKSETWREIQAGVMGQPVDQGRGKDKRTGQDQEKVRQHVSCLSGPVSKPEVRLQKDLAGLRVISFRSVAATLPILNQSFDGNCQREYLRSPPLL